MALRDQHDVFLSVFPRLLLLFSGMFVLQTLRSRFLIGLGEACPSFEDLSSLAVPTFCLPSSSGQNSVPMCAKTPSHLDMSSGQVRAILYFVLSSYFTASSGQISDPASLSSCAALASPRLAFRSLSGGSGRPWSSCPRSWSWHPGHPPVSSRSLVELAGFFALDRIYQTFCFPCSRHLSAPSPWYPPSGSLFPVMGSGSHPVLLFPGSVLAPEIASSFLLFALVVGRSFRVLDRIS